MARRLRSIAVGITLVSMAVSLVAIAVITIGVFVVAQSTFSRLMIKAGTSAAETQAMFDHGIAAIFVVAVGVATLVSAGLAVILPALLSRPPRHTASAARPIAAGAPAARGVNDGPGGGASPAHSFHQLALGPGEAEA